MGLNLLEKTELWVNEIVLDGANLTDMADAVAQVLGLSAGSVMVVDVRPRHITFDLLVKEVSQENIMGKQDELLKSLADLPGVSLAEDTYIHSNGILGLICAGEESTSQTLATVSAMTEEIRQKVSRRAIIFPTGFEVSQGMIKDTNTPYLAERLTQSGFSVTTGKVIQDTMYDFYFHLSDALNRGFGLIITTGGVGAEDKDFAVESVQAQDKTAAVCYIVKFQKGTGRHVKDGVRIAVGQVGISLMVALPGPHDEVEISLPILLRGITEGWDKQMLAESLASAIGKKYEKWKIHH